jgi:hypothetical protein
VNEYSGQSLISCVSFSIVSKVINNNPGKIYAIKKIALNKEELEKAFKGLDIMKGLKSSYFVELIDSWIEENSIEFKA